MVGRRILAVRLSSMGDVIHALPAVATLKHSFPACHLGWVVDPKWAPLLAGNPYVDEVIPLDRRRLGNIFKARQRLRAGRFDTAVDFQGLVKSALVASAARPERIYGFHQSQLRERLAALFYSHRTRADSAHIVDRNLELATAAGAANVLHKFPLPPGTPEGKLPNGDFVLACPVGGWASKQWLLGYYEVLARLLQEEMSMPLVLNGPPESAETLEKVAGCLAHCSGVEGLIDATRRATAVVGIDSGPLHLAAALDKPGVAIFGPTDPARNGPYGTTFTVLRSPVAVTSYKRRPEVDESMKRINPNQVLEALKSRLENRARPAGYEV